jgi:hypothetical protein
VKTATVRLPASPGLETILRFARDIEDFYLHDEITFDFGEATFMSFDVVSRCNAESIPLKKPNKKYSLRQL